MASLRELRKQARDKGIEGYRSMSLEDLQTALSDNGKPKRKSVTKKRATKRTAIKRTTKAKGTSPAKKTAKRATSKATTKRTNDPDAGKYFIGRLKFTGHADVWNPRDGSKTQVIFDALKSNKGDREATFEQLSAEWNKAPLNLHKIRGGDKRSKTEAMAYLRYLISRTLWDFAIKTGQHEKSENRIEYGTGENATVKAKKKTRKRTATKATKTTKKRGRPKGSKNKK